MTFYFILYFIFLWKSADIYFLAYFFFLINLFIYLFIFGCVGSSFLCEGFLQLRQAGPTLHRGARASHCRGLSLQSAGSRRAGSAVVDHGPNCSAVCGILPDQGSNPCPLHWQAVSQPLRHQGSPSDLFLKLLWEMWWSRFVLSSEFWNSKSSPQSNQNESLSLWLKSGYGLPWWRSGWESACQCRGHGFEPWSGKIPQAAEQLGPWATTTEPARLEPVLRNKRGRDSERPAHGNEERPPLATTRESPRTETKTQHGQK